MLRNLFLSRGRSLWWTRSWETQLCHSLRSCSLRTARLLRTITWMRRPQRMQSSDAACKSSAPRTANLQVWSKVVHKSQEFWRRISFLIWIMELWAKTIKMKGWRKEIQMTGISLTSIKISHCLRRTLLATQVTLCTRSMWFRTQQACPRCLVGHLRKVRK